MAIDNALFRQGLKAGPAQIRMSKLSANKTRIRCSLKTIGISLKGLSGATQCQLVGTAPLEPELVAQEALYWDEPARIPCDLWREMKLKKKDVDAINKEND